MTSIKIFLGFLFFRRKSILDAANNPSLLLPGLLFVLAAGFAREYDGEFLLAEPYHLGIPLVASIVACFCLTCLIWLLDFCINFSKSRTNWTSFFGLFIVYLTFYWLTAPLALLYGIPFERFLPEYEAIIGNTYLLGLVATWRVALIVRCTMVIFDSKIHIATIPVLFFSCLLAFFAIRLLPLPVIQFMGGIRLSSADAFLMNLSFQVTILSFFGAVLFGLAYLVLLPTGRKRTWSILEEKLKNHQTLKARVNGGLFYISIASVFVWFTFLPATQLEQYNRFLVRHFLQQKNYSEIAKFLKAKSVSDFPPYWSPPPRLGYRGPSATIEYVIFHSVVHDAPDWFVDIYISKLKQLDDHYYSDLKLLYYRTNSQKLEKFISFIKNRPVDGPRLANIYTRTDRDSTTISVPEKGDEKKIEEAKKKKTLLEELRTWSQFNSTKNAKKSEYSNRLD